MTDKAKDLNLDKLGKDKLKGVVEKPRDRLNKLGGQAQEKLKGLGRVSGDGSGEAARWRCRGIAAEKAVAGRESVKDSEAGKRGAQGLQKEP